MDMEEKLHEWLPKSSEIMNALKAEIDIIHSACEASDINNAAVLFRHDLAMLTAKWAVRLNLTKGEKLCSTQ